MYFKQIELIRNQEQKKQWKFHRVEIQQPKDQKIKEFRKYSEAIEKKMTKQTFEIQKCSGRNLYH